MIYIHNAITRLLRLLKRVMNSQKNTRTPGIDAGKTVISSDFDEPLPEFEEYL